MTIRAFEAQASWLPAVVGNRCSAVETDGGTLMSLHFGETAEAADGVVDAEYTITMEGAWRVESGGEIVAGAADPEDERSGALAEIAGNALERFDISRPGFDLTLTFENEIIIRCFPIDSLEFAEEVEDPEDVEVSWWVTGQDIPDDWEMGRAT